MPAFPGWSGGLTGRAPVLQTGRESSSLSLTTLARKAGPLDLAPVSKLPA